jgi:hypothetical protein
MEIQEMVQLINDRLYTRKKLAEELSMKADDLTEILKNAGYEYDFIEKKYLYNEVAVTIEENDEIKNESKEESKFEINEDIDVLFETIVEKPKFVPINTYLRPDINEALNRWAKDKKVRGAKQELINGLLEIALKRSGHLK